MFVPGKPFQIDVTSSLGTFITCEENEVLCMIFHNKTFDFTDTLVVYLQTRQRTTLGGVTLIKAKSMKEVDLQLIHVLFVRMGWYFFLISVPFKKFWSC